jgi:DNA-binding PadR family transcriptional regulator
MPDSGPLQPAAFHILLALSDGERHGYAIMGDVEALSDGALRIGPGTLYGTIKRLLAAGLISETQSRPDPELDDQRRRYYQLTPDGAAVLRAEAARLARLTAIAADRNLVRLPLSGPEGA